MVENFLYPTFEAGKHLFQKNIQGEIVNINLIRLKKVADYSQYPDLEPANPISGKEAFLKYVEETKPFLEASGGEILFIGQGDHFLIGPDTERWDLCMLIKQKSVNEFFSFEQNEIYMKIARHRLAAIEDARLLPLEQLLLNRE